MSEPRPRIAVPRLATALLPLAALLLVEGVLWVLPVGGGDREIDIGPFDLTATEMVDGEPHFRVTHPSVYADRDRLYAREKPAGTLRVFLLGGSAAAGWPHPPLETAGAYLERALQHTYRERRVELINLCAHGFAGYRVRSLCDRVVDLDPDLVLVWSGNNEFLEPRSYDTSALRRFLDALPFEPRLVSLLRGLTDRAALPGAEPAGVAEALRKDLQREAVELRSDPEQFARVKAHYAASLEHVARACRARGVPLALLTVPVNLRDWEPNVSADEADPQTQQRWRRAWRAGRGALLRDDLLTAARELGTAIGLRPEHAETWFRLARVRERAHDPVGAREAYGRARDLDLNPSRAHGDFNADLRAIARAHAGVHLVDLALSFAAIADGAPGFAWFIDDVHPTHRGNRLIARLVHDAVVGGGWLTGTPSDARFHYVAARYGEADEEYDESVDLRLQQTAYSLRCTHHQYDAAIAKGEYVIDLIENRNQEIRGVAQRPRRPSDALLEGVAAFRRLRGIEDRWFRGEEIRVAEWEAAEARVAAFYRQWFRQGRH